MYNLIYNNSFFSKTAIITHIRDLGSLHPYNSALQWKAKAKTKCCIKISLLIKFKIFEDEAQFYYLKCTCPTVYTVM